jgi:hypothetical protein
MTEADMIGEADEIDPIVMMSIYCVQRPLGNHKRIEPYANHSCLQLLPVHLVLRLVCHTRITALPDGRLAWLGCTDHSPGPRQVGLGIRDKSASLASHRKGEFVLPQTGCRIREGGKKARVQHTGLHGFQKRKPRTL